MEKENLCLILPHLEKHYNWLYQLNWKCKLATVMSYKGDVSRVSPSSEIKDVFVIFSASTMRTSSSFCVRLCGRRLLCLVRWQTTLGSSAWASVRYTRWTLKTVKSFQSDVVSTSRKEAKNYQIELEVLWHRRVFLGNVIDVEFSLRSISSSGWEARWPHG